MELGGGAYFDIVIPHQEQHIELNLVLHGFKES